ncbi:DUF421 domain-containing protein [Jeotgalibacillus proteolyticus]|uniref:DUF421 domain-containing protein n=1 Tax=Jeotgalibacillus proteolyticus TaxID=2082395 RepID=A0A2S5G8H1_9BACL|nr:DUF421 domain-containing protein [Jeotgalibacillus proteolyticus]PPA69278.1 DUF421 domain-containing protein [Jeotgalibacillus proteolyticus]
MIEVLKDILLVVGRIATIVPLMLIMTLYMGKRAIGELPVFDFLIILTLGAVVGADIADPDIHHLPTAAAIIFLAVFQRLVARWKISNRKLGQFITFEPTVVVQNGVLLDQNMKKINYSINNILQMLREKDVFDLQDVETAIVEANGSLSVLKKPPLSPSGISAEKPSPIAFPVMMDGTIYPKVLEHFNVDEAWLRKQLAEQGISDEKNIFYASINPDLKLHISLKNEGELKVPPFFH